MTSLRRQGTAFPIFDFLFWILLAIAFPLAGGNFSIYNVAHIFIYVAAVYYVSDILFYKFQVFQDMPFLIRSGLYILLGSIICGLLFLVFYTAFLFYFLFAFFIFDIYKNKKLSFEFDWRSGLCLLPFFLMLFQTMELVYGTIERYTYWDGDYYLYTAITESLRSNQSVNNAVFHSGISINYAIAPFLAPANLAKFAQIPSQFALWGVVGKLLPVICFGSLSYFIARLSQQITVNKTANDFFRRNLLASFLLLFLGPLHFLKLKQLDFSHVLFLGEGYVLPIGSPGFSLGLFLAGLIIYLVLRREVWSIWYKTLLVFLLSVLVASKLAMFLPLVAFLGILSVFRLLKKDRHLFYVLLAALPVVVMVYMLTSASKDAMITSEFTPDGYYKNYYATLAEKYNIQGSTLKKVVLMFGFSLVMWLSIKFAVMAVAAASLYKKNKEALALIAAALLGFVISCMPAFFINSYGVDLHGKFLFDAAFDMAQFTRASIFILTIIASIFVLYLIFDHQKLWLRKLSALTVCFWMALISLGFFTGNYGWAATAEKPWYREVRKDFLTHKPRLMAMLGHPEYSGQVLTNAGVHPWYCTGTRFDGGGHLMSRKAHERNKIFKQVFDTTKEIAFRRSVVADLKRRGVDCLVATPHSLSLFEIAVQDSLVTSVPGTKWLYNLN